MDQQQVIDELWEHIFDLRGELNKYKDYSERLEKLNEARIKGIDYIKEIAGIGNKYGLVNHVYAQYGLNTEAVDNVLEILEGDD